MNESIVKKFRGVPQAVKAAISRPEVLEKLERLEDTYDVSLAETLIRLAAKDLRLDALPGHLTTAFSLSPEETKELTASLTKDILGPILSYLNEPAAPVRPPTQQAPQRPSAPAQPMRVQAEGPPPVPAPRAPSPIPPRPVSPVPQQPRTAPPPPKLPVAPASLIAPARPQPKIAAPAPAPRLPSPPVPSQPPAPPRVAVPTPQPKPLPTIPPTVPPQAVRRSVATYVVSPEDEADIAKHRDRLTQMSGASPTADLERVIAELVDRRALTFATPVLEKRFVTATLSRLRDVRTSAALQELLERSEKIGGLGLSHSLVRAIIEDVDALARQLHEKGALPPPAMKPKPRPSGPPPVTAPMVAVPVSPLPLRAAPGPSVQQNPPKPVPAPMAVPAAPRPSSVVRRPSPPQPLPNPMPAAIRKPLLVDRPQIRRPAATDQHGRPMMADVTVPRQKPMGPVDELAALNVREFRALAPNPRDAANKILEKIDLLTEESYPLRAESVKAWRGSPLFRLYVELGQESLVREKTIEEVVASRQETNTPSLSLQEFAIIADINKHLIP